MVSAAAALRRCPLLAQSRHCDRRNECPLLGVKQTSLRAGGARFLHRKYAGALLFLFRGRAGPAIRRQSLWGLSRRTLAIDHLLYESNSGFWRWVTGGCGNVLSIDVVVIASTRPPPKWLLGLGQP
jgi:hypothetical protein